MTEWIHIESNFPVIISDWHSTKLHTFIYTNQINLQINIVEKTMFLTDFMDYDESRKAWDNYNETLISNQLTDFFPEYKSLVNKLISPIHTRILGNSWIFLNW